MAIDLALDQRQQDLQRSAHELFADRCPSSVVREVESGAVGYLPDLWQEMARRGWLGLTFPAAYGGGGGGVVDLYPLYEEMGRYLVPSPHLDTVAVTGDLLVRAGTEEQRRQLLPAIAEGRCIVSLALLEPSGTFGSRGIELPARRRGADFVLEGTKLLVAHAGAADHLLCAARTGEPGDTGDGGITLFLVDTGSGGVTTTAVPNVAGLPLHAVDLAGVVVPADALIGEVGGGWGPLSRSTTAAAVAQTATIVGAARAVLEMTNQYAKDRVQFGTPIGVHQAVQYMVTDVLIDLHNVDLLARHAAYRIDAGSPHVRQASAAVAHGKEAAAHLHRQAHEVFAGAAFMVRHDLQLYSRRSKYWENNLGSARYHREQLARTLAG